MNLTELSLKTPFPGKIFYVKVTGSTMELARQLATSPESPPQGTVVLAGAQTRGKGRGASRIWTAQADQNLLFTLLLFRNEMKIPLSVFPLAAGLAMARVLEGEGVTPRIKWPNDILVDGKKICGILCETVGKYLSTGIGLNCLQTRFPEGLGSKAVSLALLTGRNTNPFGLLELFLPEMAAVLDEKDWRKELMRRLLGLNREVLLMEGTADHALPVRGNILGIGEQGELLFQPEKGDLKQVFTGEIVYENDTV